MELNIKDRLYFSQLLPANNTFLDFVTKKAIIEKIAITEKDKEEFDIKEVPNEGRITWNIEKDMANPLVVEFTPQELEYLKKGCEQASETSHPDNFWATVEKIYNAINA